MSSPVQQAFAILFLGGAAVFAIWAFAGMTAEKQRADAAAQGVGFSDSDEMSAAKQKASPSPGRIEIR
jgi:hypothetical protein